MRSTSGYASIWCILLHQLQPRDMMAPITRGMPNVWPPRYNLSCWNSAKHCKAWSNRLTDLLRRENGQNMQSLDIRWQNSSPLRLEALEMGLWSVEATQWLLTSNMRLCPFCPVEVLNKLKTSHRTKRTSPDIAGQGAYSPNKKQT